MLASSSPRRRQLLADAGLKFIVRPPAVDESSVQQAGQSPVDLAKQLAYVKAMDVAKAFPYQLVIGADTIVESDGRIYGKPRDADHAKSILSILFSRPHRVITGLALVRLIPPVELVEADITIIYPRPLDQALLAQYITSGQWQGKAGAYGIQEQGSEPFIEGIDGSFTNVVGLPMELLGRMLDRAGYQSK
ncbi:MAG: nucleoside triphosphate pyrophosphatase [Sedimentisphaerales bacterium]|nr:nucleoside triphosphate pyrophosphatase [Sedimentisphaerales bacterium]